MFLYSHRYTMLFSSGVRFQRWELFALHLAATISRSRRPARRDRCKTDERGGGSPQVRSTFLSNSLPSFYSVQGGAWSGQRRGRTWGQGDDDPAAAEEDRRPRRGQQPAGESIAMSRRRFLFFKTSLAPQIHELSKLGEKVTTGGRCVKKTSMQVRLSFLKLKFPSWSY